jgi:hypothetical protein
MFIVKVQLPDSFDFISTLAGPLTTQEPVLDAEGGAALTGWRPGPLLTDDSLNR